MTVLVYGALFLAVVCGARLTFWVLHVTSDRDDQ